MSLGKTNNYMPRPYTKKDHLLIEKIQEFARTVSVTAGDRLRLGIVIAEGKGNRLQRFTGVIIKKQGKTDATQTVTVRRIFQGVGVERVVPLNSPLVSEITVERSSQVNQSRIYFLRERYGKATRLKQRLEKVQRPAVNT